MQRRLDHRDDEEHGDDAEGPAGTFVKGADRAAIRNFATRTAGQPVTDAASGATF